MIVFESVCPHLVLLCLMAHFSGAAKDNTNSKVQANSAGLGLPSNPVAAQVSSTGSGKDTAKAKVIDANAKDDAKTNKRVDSRKDNSGANANGHALGLNNANTQTNKVMAVAKDDAKTNKGSEASSKVQANSTGEGLASNPITSQVSSKDTAKAIEPVATPNKNNQQNTISTNNAKDEDNFRTNFPDVRRKKGNKDEAKRHNSAKKRKGKGRVKAHNANGRNNTSIYVIREYNVTNVYKEISLQNSSDIDDDYENYENNYDGNDDEVSTGRGLARGRGTANANNKNDVGNNNINKKQTVNSQDNYSSQKNNSNANDDEKKNKGNKDEAKGNANANNKNDDKTNKGNKDETKGAYYYNNDLNNANTQTNKDINVKDDTKTHKDLAKGNDSFSRKDSAANDDEKKIKGNKDEAKGNANANNNNGLNNANTQTNKDMAVAKDDAKTTKGSEVSSKVQANSAGAGLAIEQVTTPNNQQNASSTSNAKDEAKTKKDTGKDNAVANANANANGHAVGLNNATTTTKDANNKTDDDEKKNKGNKDNTKSDDKQDNSAKMEKVKEVKTQNERNIISINKDRDYNKTNAYRDINFQNGTIKNTKFQNSSDIYEDDGKGKGLRGKNRSHANANNTEAHNANVRNITSIYIGRDNNVTNSKNQTQGMGGWGRGWGHTKKNKNKKPLDKIWGGNKNAFSENDDYDYDYANANQGKGRGRFSGKGKGKVSKVKGPGREIVQTSADVGNQAVSRQFNISSCPLRYYGKTYKKIYVNSTSNGFYICFNCFYNSDWPGDCIRMPSLSVQIVKVIVSSRVRLDRTLLLNIPAIAKQRARCSVKVRVSFTDKISELKFYKFGVQTAIHLDAHAKNITGVVDFRVHGLLQSFWEIDGSINVNADHYLLVTACRYGDSVVAPKTILSLDPDTCTKKECSEFGVLKTTGCGPMQSCIGNNRCTLDAMCSVLGASIIDISGSVKDIPTRCGYVLMSTANFSVQASFRERRRTDVHFLDSLRVKIHADKFILDQGGRVYVNGDRVSISGSPHEYNDVEIYKDETGVTLTKSFSQFTVSVVYDGTTAQISYTGLGAKDMSGVCSDSNSMWKNIIRSKDCAVLYQDVPDPSINGTNMVDRCGVFTEPPFWSCNEEIDPSPYIDVCNRTFSRYPDEDGLFCQLLQSYTRACNLRDNSSVAQDASQAFGCPGSSAMCQEVFCSDHEFCGISFSGEPYCFCRGIFAAPYRQSKTYGTPTVCGFNSATVSLYACLLEEKGFDYTQLHLRDDNCEGAIDEETHLLSFSFSDSEPCGADIQVNGSQIMYTNRISSQNSSAELITRRSDFHIEVSCIYSQPQDQSVAIRVKETSVVQHIIGLWNYTLLMTPFLDKDLTKAVSLSTEILLDQVLYVELLAADLDRERYAIVIDSCWATNQPPADSTKRYQLFSQSCDNTADQTVKILKNGEGSSCVFSFNMFQFTGHTDSVFLHCKVHLCVKRTPGFCIPSCPVSASRSRRSTKKKRKRAPSRITLITMAFQG